MVGESRFELAEKTRSAYIQGRDLVDSDSHVSVECLRFGSGGRMTGAIGFEGLRHPAQTKGSLAALTAALVDRTKAFRNASATAAAAQAESYRSAILDALAHEFKTPLATILAAAGGIREAGPLVPAQREMADTVENEAARLGSLTSRLLRTARLDTQEIRPRMEVIDITSLIHHIATQYSNRSQDRRIVRAYRLETIEVLADPELLRLPVSQLLDNACKYSQPGSIVTIEIERQDGNVAVKISNNRRLDSHQRAATYLRTILSGSGNQALRFGLGPGFIRRAENRGGAWRNSGVGNRGLRKWRYILSENTCRERRIRSCPYIKIVF